MRQLRHTFIAIALTASVAQAQDTRTKIREIFHFGSCAALVCLSTTTGVHGDHYNPDAAAKSMRSVYAFLRTSLSR